MKKCLISLITLILVISLSTSVYAATGSISAKANATTVKKGDTVTVTISSTASNPIDGMYTKYSYDKNVLELKETNEGNGYGDYSGTGEIFVTNKSAETSPTSATLYTLTFKVLENTTAEKATITFSESALHLNEDNMAKDTSASIANVEINIKAEEQGGEDNKEPENPGDNKDPEDNKQPEGNKPSDKEDNSTSGGNKLPQTGIESAIIIAILVVTIASVVTFVSYRKYKDIR